MSESPSNNNVHSSPRTFTAIRNTVPCASHLQLCASLALLFLLLLTLAPSAAMAREQLSGQCQALFRRPGSESVSISLEAVIGCIRDAMPANNVVMPSTRPNSVAAWKLVVDEMVADGEAGKCAVGSQWLPPPLRSAYTRILVSDVDTGLRFCVLYENLLAFNQSARVGLGWGTFIVPLRDSQSTTKGHIAVSAPHPISDGNEIYTATVFKLMANQSAADGYRGLSLHIAGSARNVSVAPIDDDDDWCRRRGKYFEADATHNVDNMLFATYGAILQRHQSSQSPLLFVQLHVMADTSCPGVDVYVSDGVALASELWNPTLRRIRQRFAASESIAIADRNDGRCRLKATDNVQGRLVNNLPAAVRSQLLSATEMDDDSLRILCSTPQDDLYRAYQPIVERKLHHCVTTACDDEFHNFGDFVHIEMKWRILQRNGTVTRTLIDALLNSDD